MQFFMWQLLRGVHALHCCGVLHRDIKPSNLLVNANCELKIADFGISCRAEPSFGASLAGARAGSPPPSLPATDCATSGATGSATGEATPAPAAGSAASGAHPTVGAHDGGVLPFLNSTPQVVTLWYRPPELLCGNTTYGSAIDMWSCGVALAEMLGRSPPFSGDNHMKMLRQIIAQLGSPSVQDVTAIDDPRAIAFLRKIGDDVPSRPWAERYPEAPSGAIALLASLLVFDPARRPHAASALRAPWLQSLHQESDLEDDPTRPRCEFPFEGCAELNLDHFLLAGLDEVHHSWPEYPLQVGALQRFGIMHSRSVDTIEQSEGTDLGGVLVWEDDDL